MLHYTGADPHNLFLMASFEWGPHDCHINLTRGIIRVAIMCRTAISLSLPVSSLILSLPFSTIAASREAKTHYSVKQGLHQGYRTCYA
ncbi:hypothetical protein CR513_50100, partial [Mucuna pruriens]